MIIDPRPKVGLQLSVDSSLVSVKVNFWCRKRKRFKFSSLSELRLFLVYFCLILALICIM